MVIRNPMIVMMILPEGRGVILIVVQIPFQSVLAIHFLVYTISCETVLDSYQIFMDI